MLSPIVAKDSGLSLDIAEIAPSLLGDAGLMELRGLETRRAWNAFSHPFGPPSAPFDSNSNRKRCHKSLEASARTGLDEMFALEAF